MAKIKRKRKQKRSGVLRGTVTLQVVTKQDFVAIAEVLCTTAASSETKNGIAGYFKAQNPRFNVSRFLTEAMKCSRSWMTRR